MKIHTLSFRLTFWYFLILNLSFLSIFLILYFSLVSKIRHDLDEELLEDVTEYQSILQKEGLQKLKQDLDKEMTGPELEKSFVLLMDSHNEVVYASELDHWPSLHPFLSSSINKTTSSFSYQSFILPEMQHDTRLIIARTGGYTFAIGESLRDKEEILSLLISTMAYAFIGITPISLLIGWWIARKAVKGINAVSVAADQIQQGELNSFVNIKNQDHEVQRLVDTFNAMAHRIRKLINEMREMNDNIAHDLRSPITRIRSLSEMALSADNDEYSYKRFAEDILLECERLIHLINITLDVAEVEANVAKTKQDKVPVKNLIEDAFDLFRPVAEEKHIKFEILHNSQKTFQGNRQSLQRMLANIVDNALKYTPDNGTVSLDAADDEHGIKIRIFDTGVGIPIEDQDRIFERFYRCDQSRNSDGFGLGLSFAQAVARAHGGQIELTSEPGKFSSFIISLPNSYSD